MEKLHRLKSQPIFSEASQTEWREPFDFPTRMSGFPTKMVSTPNITHVRNLRRALTSLEKNKEQIVYQKSQKDMNTIAKNPRKNSRLNKCVQNITSFLCI